MALGSHRSLSLPAFLKVQRVGCKAWSPLSDESLTLSMMVPDATFYFRLGTYGLVFTDESEQSYQQALLSSD